MKIQNSFPLLRYPGCKKIIQFHKLPTSAQFFKDYPGCRKIIQFHKRLPSGAVISRGLSRLQEDYPVSQTSYFGRNYFKEANPVSQASSLGRLQEDSSFTSVFPWAQLFQEDYPGCKKIIQFHKLPTSGDYFKEAYPGCRKIIQFHKRPSLGRSYFKRIIQVARRLSSFTNFLLRAQLFQRSLSRLQEDNPVSQASSLGRSYFKRIIQVARRLSSFTNFLLRAQLFQRSLSRLHEDYPASQIRYLGCNF